ncbi:MAG: hypothetical protein HY319_23055 [Armatimonadetes bacterium]|nr:hypothetical protein [Armatimonadota bacterium]
MKIPSARISAPASSRGQIPAGSPQAEPPAAPGVDSGASALDAVASPSSPKLVEPDPRDLRRAYLWRAIPMPGPVEAVVGAVVNLEFVARWMGLEPPPRGTPSIHRLDFAWNGISRTDFQARAHEMESRLATARTALGKRSLAAADGRKYLVSVDTGLTAIWSPRAFQRSEKSRDRLEKGQEERREVAAYLVDKHLGHYARVPPQVLAELDGRPGTLGLFVPAASFGDNRASLEKMAPEDYRRLALFDHVIGNLDRHDSNWLLDYDGRPVPIDHGLAFPLENSDQGFHNFCFDRSFPLDRDELAMLGDFLARRREIQEDLAPYLDARAIAAMFQRVERMVDSGGVDSWWRLLHLKPRSTAPSPGTGAP